MRFVACLFGIIFTLLSLVEFAGGSFWTYRAINAAADAAWWVTFRPRRTPKPIPEEEIELVNQLPAV